MVDRDDKKPLFSNAMLHFLQHRLMEIFGLALFLLSCLLLIALITAAVPLPQFVAVVPEIACKVLGDPVLAFFCMHRWL